MTRLLALSLLVVSLWVALGQSLPRQPIFNIVSYGAVPDGKTINTCAIQKAIDDAGAAGGGTVFVPSAQLSFITGAINITYSNITLYLDEGAQLYGSDNASDYAAVQSVTSDTGPFDYPLLFIYNASNVVITGGGSINGGANDPPGHLVEYYNETLNFLIPQQWSLPGCSGYSCRPKLLVVRFSHGIVVSNVSLLNSVLWTVTLVQSRDILLDKVLISGDRRWPNNDGIDPIGSSDIIIQNSVISTGDDSVCCITHTPDPIRNVTVKGCTLSSTSTALKVSAFESTASGDIEDITYRDNLVLDTNRGLGVMPRWGSSRIRRVYFENIKMQTRWFSQAWWGAGEAIYVTVLGESSTNQWNGTVSDIYFTNITSLSENGAVLYAPAPFALSSVQFSGVNITIAKFSNYTNPVHDWRPSPPPSLLPAPVNAYWSVGASKLSFKGCSGSFSGTTLPYWGSCANITGAYSAHNLKCQNP